MSAKQKIILALDVDNGPAALETVDRFGGRVNIYKVGLELFTAEGPSIVRDIQARGKKVFLDLKFHDIPNTVAKAARTAARLGVFMFNIHASAGSEAMRRARDEVVELSLKENLPRPLLIAVTVLTSQNQDELKTEFGIQHSLRTHVKHLAGLAKNAGLDGVVASGQEVSMIKEHLGGKFLIVTPGIRPSSYPPDDQKRTMTPREALRAGADFIVLGRAVTGQKDPEKALEQIESELA
ncbi:MAG: orotidine-5'-phosphate decarboxylase [Nitrospiraceae bacterium]|nr:orotidine-5'-phosphate decarboxylase [Nitrospiraceae bacterium]